MRVFLGNNITKTDPAYQVRAFQRKLPLMIRAALEKVFYAWFKKHARKHFSRAAFTRYLEEYKDNSKINKQAWLRRNAWRVKKGLDTEFPLVRTGALMRNFLGGNLSFSKMNDELKVKWHGLPTYAYAYHKNKIGMRTQMNKAKGLVAVNEEETTEFQALFDKFLQAEIDKFDNKGKITPKTYGRVIF